MLWSDISEFGHVMKRRSENDDVAKITKTDPERHPRVDDDCLCLEVLGQKLTEI